MSTDIEAALRDPLNVSEADLAKLIGEATGEETGAAEDLTGDEGDSPPEQGSETEGAQATGKPEGKQDEPAIDPANAEVLTRDGKHRIPYSVLEAERARAQEASRQAEAAQQLAQQEAAQRQVLERQLAELTQKAQSVQAEAAGGKKDTTADLEQIIKPDELDAIREEAPELAAVFDRLIDTVKSAQAQVAQANERVTQIESERQQEVQQRHRTLVESAIGNNPKLVYTRAEKPEVFNAIVEVDDWVRQQPFARGMSLEDRFAKSVAMYEAAHGAIEVPGNAKPGPKTVSDAAAAAIAKASAPVPNTLSDLPGGELPPKSDAEVVGAMNATDLTAKMMEMTPDQIDKLLARLSV